MEEQEYIELGESANALWRKIEEIDKAKAELDKQRTAVALLWSPLWGKHTDETNRRKYFTEFQAAQATGK
jgi:hypothetical protein